MRPLRIVPASRKQTTATVRGLLRTVIFLAGTKGLFFRIMARLSVGQQDYSIICIQVW